LGDSTFKLRRSLKWTGVPAPRIVNQTLTPIADYSGRAIGLRPGSRSEIESGMQRLRLKADGRIVELRDGREFPLVPTSFVAPEETASAPAVRDLRKRARLTQQEFAARLGVPVETIRNWEQGKRMPRGPARALLAVIAHAPETVFAALARA
jgi:putative transcriptional regulator